MPLLWVSIAFITGLLMEDWLAISWVVWAVISATSLFLALYKKYWGKSARLLLALPVKMPVSAGVLLLCFAFGGLRGWFARNPLINQNDLAWYNNRGEYVFTGWVTDAPDRRDNMVVYTMKIIEIRSSNRTTGLSVTKRIDGLAQVRMPTYTQWEYGNVLTFTGSPKEPADHSDFSYKEYLAIRNVRTIIYFPRVTQKIDEGYGSSLRALLIRAREQARLRILKIFPQPEAGLLIGILLGMDNDLPDTLAQSYRNTGTSHIIAISGFNFSVLALAFVSAFKRVSSPYWAALIMAVLLVIYTFFIHSSASVVRALIMAIIAAGGHLIGRRQVGLNALAFTAAVMCFANPLLIKDISFQLSFAATFGLVVFSQPIRDWLSLILEKRMAEKTASRWGNLLAEYIFLTLAAQFATLPITAAHFGRVSISALLANPLVLPLQPAVLILGGITTLIGAIHPLAGKVIAVFSWPFLYWSNTLVTLLDRLNKGYLILHPAFAWGTLLFCCGFILIFLAREQLSRFFHSRTFHWMVFLLTAAIFSLVSIHIRQPDNSFHIYLFPAGEETTLAIQPPRGGMLLVNPQGDMDELTSAFEKHLSPWSFQLSGVLLTNRNSADSLSELQNRIEINQLLLAPTVYQQKKEIRPLFIPDKLGYAKLLPGQIIGVGSEVKITLLSEGVANTALSIESGTQHILIPNGVELATIRQEYPDYVSGLTILILGEEDTTYLPIRVWKQLSPNTILWKDRSVSPFENALSVQENQTINLAVDIHSTQVVR